MAGTLKDDLLPLIDELRGLAGEYGFRPIEVWVRVVEWSGPRAGVGTKTETDTRLLAGGRNPKVRELSRKDVVAGESEYVHARYEIGPLTPKFPGGGVAAATLNPPKGENATEVFYILKGDGLPEEGLLCVREGDAVAPPMRRMIHVRSLGRKA